MLSILVSVSLALQLVSAFPTHLEKRTTGISVPLARRSGNRVQAAACSNLRTTANATECIGFSPVNNGFYFGNVTIGSDQAQSFNLILDSGSSDLWIYSNNGNTSSPYIWTPALSSSSVNAGTNSSIEYADGQNETYSWFVEPVTFGGVTAQKVYTGAAYLSEQTITPGTGPTQNMSGILGIGWPALNDGGYLPFVQQAYNESLIPANSYGLYLGNEDNSTNGELTLGGVNTALYTGDIQYFNVTPYPTDFNTSADTTEYYFFNVNVTSVQIGNSTVNYNNGSQLYIVDSGTSFLDLPSSVIAELTALVNLTLISTSTVSGGYAIPCENIATAPDLTFVINDSPYVIPASVWTHRDPTLVEAGVECFAEIYDGGNNTGGILDANFLFGDTFLRQYYTVLDFDNHRVGFANISTS